MHFFNSFTLHCSYFQSIILLCFVESEYKQQTLDETYLRLILELVKAGFTSENLSRSCAPLTLFTQYTPQLFMNINVHAPQIHTY